MEIKEGARFSTGLEEFDRVLGGGAFCGSIVLIGGEPGIGKSTLMLQSAMNMARQGLPVLYATGEESLQQVAHRAARVGEPPSNLMLLPTTDLEAVQRETQRGSYRVLVTDSIQTSAPGTFPVLRALFPRSGSAPRNSVPWPSPPALPFS